LLAADDEEEGEEFAVERIATVGLAGPGEFAIWAQSLGTPANTRLSIQNFRSLSGAQLGLPTRQKEFNPDTGEKLKNKLRSHPNLIVIESEIVR
jgi:hypothetical protein